MAARTHPNRSLRMAGLAGAVAGLLVLTACTSSETSEADSTPTAPATLGWVSSIDDLVDAYTSAGGVCDWDRSDVVTKASASGSCSLSSVLSVFDTTEDRNAVINGMALFPVEVTLLVGDNWIINSHDAPGMASRFGGKPMTGRIAPPASTDSQSFCDVFSSGNAAYFDFVTSIGASLDAATFTSTIQPYIAHLKRLAPAGVESDLADYTSVADQIAEAIDGGAGYLNLSTTDWKYGTAALLAHCAAE